MNRLPLALVLLFLLAPGAFPAAKASPERAWPTAAPFDHRGDLLELVRSADDLVVVEHSAPDDHRVTVDAVAYRESSYSGARLEVAELAAFVETLANLDPAPRGGGVLPCTFAPHHTVYLRQKGNPLARFELDLNCLRVEGREDPPLLQALTSMVASIGMEPHRDWKAIAAERAKVAAKGAEEGRIYLEALARQVRRADRIVVTEHSYESDAFDKVSGQSLVPRDVAYATRTLGSAQRAALADEIATLEPFLPEFYAGCFEPHHALRFFSAGKLESTLEVCFECGGVQWDHGKGSYPASLVDALARLVVSLGMQPHRPWRALAEERASGR